MCIAATLPWSYSKTGRLEGLKLDLTSSHPEPDRGGDGYGELTSHFGPGSHCGSDAEPAGATLLALLVSMAF